MYKNSKLKQTSVACLLMPQVSPTASINITEKRNIYDTLGGFCISYAPLAEILGQFFMAEDM